MVTGFRKQELRDWDSSVAGGIVEERRFQRRVNPLRFTTRAWEGPLFHGSGRGIVERKHGMDRNQIGGSGWSMARETVFP